MIKIKGKSLYGLINAGQSSMLKELETNKPSKMCGNIHDIRSNLLFIWNSFVFKKPHKGQRVVTYLDLLFIQPPELINTLVFKELKPLLHICAKRKIFFLDSL